MTEDFTAPVVNLSALSCILSRTLHTLSGLQQVVLRRSLEPTGQEFYKQGKKF